MIKEFITWCNRNHLHLRRNEELFFIDEYLVIKPDFIINSKIYVDIIKSNEITDHYLKGCEIFGKSHGILMIIPLDDIQLLNGYTKQQIMEIYDIEF